MTDQAAKDQVMRSLRVLVVDDHATMRHIVRSLLAQGDIHDVEEAANGEQALERLLDPRLDELDVVICDLHMDNMDGLDFCQHVRMNKELGQKHIPIIILTGEKTDMVLETALQVGATKVLQKPVSAPDLLHEVGCAIGFYGSTPCAVRDDAADSAR